MDGVSPAELDINPEAEMKTKSLSGKELPANWPPIIRQEEEDKAYSALRDPDENPAEPPRNAHIDRLSYELTNGDKRLRKVKCGLSITNSFLVSGCWVVGDSLRFADPHPVRTSPAAMTLAISSLSPIILLPPSLEFKLANYTV